MKVVQIVDSLKVGGAQKLLVTLAEAAARRGDLELTVVGLTRADSPIPDELRRLGVAVELFAGHGLRDPLRLARLVRFLRRGGYDAVHTHLTFGNTIGGLAGKLAGVGVVASLHSSGFGQARSAPWRRFAGNFLEVQVLRRCARRRAAVGHLVADANRERLAPSEIVVVPNAVRIPDPVPAEEVEAVRAELVGSPVDGGGAPFLIVTLGRLSPEKGYDDLLRAFAEVVRARPEARLAIAGQGKLRDALEAQAAELGLSGRASLLGLRGDVPRLLAASDAFVLSSTWEALPVAVLEAMAAGLPVVATTVGEVARVVVPGTGILVPPGEPPRLAEALLELAGDPAKRRALGEAARAHIDRHYSVDVWVDRLLELYGEARLP